MMMMMNACSSDGEVLRFVTVNQAQYLNFACFFEIKWKNINFSFHSYRISDADDADTYFLAHYRQFQLVFHHLHAVKVLLYTESVAVVTFGHVTKMAVKPFDPAFPKTP